MRKSKQLTLGKELKTKGGKHFHLFSKQKEKVKAATKEVKSKRDKALRELKGKKKLLDQFRGIRVKILGAFMIPVILMGVFGVVSYNKTSDAIITNYEANSLETLSAVSNFLDLGLDSVSDKMVELMLSDNLSNYFLRTNKVDTLDDYQTFKKLQKDTYVIGETNKFVKNVHLMADVGYGISTLGSAPKDLYDQFIESDEGKAILESKNRYNWLGYHNFLDETLKLKNEDYSISLIGNMSSIDGYIVMDISTKEIKKAFEDISLDNGTIVGFITADGRETIVNDDITDVFVGTKFYEKASTDEAEKGNSYEEFQNEEYLFSYSKVGDTGHIICALIPKAFIMNQAEDIRNWNIVFVVIAGLFAILMGIAISGGIGKAIDRLMRSIATASKGDLTTEFHTKRKDEFKFLSKGLNNMTESMRKLIGEVAGVGGKVTGSADSLSATSELILAATKDISITIDEIEKGVVQQAEDTENCLTQMAKLSNQINQVYDNTYEIEKIAGDTRGVVEKGIVIIDELNNKTKATADVTQIVIKDIEELEVQSRSIGNFVEMINEIASQTNLLSLNASIEAARAGDAGRGFAVVADEIRKLADQSVQAVSQIQSIVSTIQGKTKGTVVSAKQAEEIVDSQTTSLKRTIRAFEDINTYVGKLVTNLEDISHGVKSIEAAKEDTLEAISNISAVSQQTAAASEEVSATANGQISSVESLSLAALELAADAKTLEAAIKRFKI
ncbi:MAG: methyl-accepting chemotaxis protein [Anaerocolumna sp.]